MTVPRPQFSLKTLLWLMVVVAAFLALAVRFWPRIKVKVENDGQRPARQIVLHVTGNSYRLGDLAPGESKEVAVRPTGESTLKIEFEDEAGSKFLSDVNEYIEPGYSASISVVIRDGVVDSWTAGARY